MRKRTKKAWSFLLSLAMLAGILLPTGAAQAAQYTYGYEENGTGTINILQLPGECFDTGICEIPQTIDGYTVTELYWDLFTDGIVTFSVPGTVKAIPRALFREGRALKTLTLHDGVETIERMAFSKAVNLSSVTLSSTLKTIGGEAFGDCYALENISLPQGLESIGGRAFCYTALEEVTLPNSVTSLGAEAFRGCGELENVRLSSGMKEIAARTFTNCENLSAVTIPKSIQSIGEDAFSGCSGLETIYFGGSEAEWQSLLENTDSSNDVLENVTVIYDGGTIETPDGEEAIPTPVNLTLTSTQDGIEIAWNVPLEVESKWVYDGFDILSRTAGATYFNKVAHVDDFTNDYLDAKVTDGVRYEYAVRATNGSETGEMSEVQSIVYDANAHHAVGMNGASISLGNQGFGSGQYAFVDNLWLTTGSEGMRISLVFDEPLQDEDVTVTVTGGGKTYQGTNIAIIGQQLNFTLALTDGNHLKPDTTYTARVLDERGNVLAQWDFESAGEETQSWGFTNIDSSYDYADLVRYYPSSIASKLSSLDKSHGEDGLCFGMALAAGLWKEGRMPQVQGGHEILNTMSWDTILGSGQWLGVSLKDYIQACNALQFSQAYASQTRDNKFDYDGLVREVKSGEPVLIGTWIDGTGHAVLAYDYEEVGTDFIIYVQDPQCMPYQIATLTLHGTSGHWSGWSYERRGVTNDSDGAKDDNMEFSWRSVAISPDDDFDVDSVLVDIKNNITTNIGDDVEEIWDNISGGAKVAFTPLAGTSMGWLDGDGDISLDSLEDAVEFVDSEKSVTVDAPSAQFTLEKGIAQAQASGSGTLSLICTAGDTTITFRGTAADGVRMVREADGVRFEGAQSGSVVVEEGNATKESITITAGEDVRVSLDGEIEEEPTALPFTDVRAGAWYYDAVDYVYQKGLMTGTGENAFSPDMAMTRGMIVTILHRMDGAPNVGGRYSFEDVPYDAWYSQAVFWAERRGIVSGYSSESFGPNDPITREQLAAILCNYSAYKGNDTSERADLSKYSDVSAVSSWANNSLSWANAKGYVSGMTQTTLEPKGAATRAQVAAIIERYQNA